MTQANKKSYEEACKISKGIVTADRLAKFGTVPVMAEYTEALADAGWTLKELTDEARNRMIAFIESLKNEESK